MNAKKTTPGSPAKVAVASLPQADVRSRIVFIRQLPVIIDADVAVLYGVETKRVNEAVRNNPDKFPQDYMFELNAEESRVLRSKISTLELSGKGRHSKYNFKAFTEKGLYMLATILKSKRAMEATFAIIETFAKVLKSRSRTSRRLSSPGWRSAVAGRATHPAVSR